jgi:hypothetical protein
MGGSQPGRISTHEPCLQAAHVQDDLYRLGGVAYHLVKALVKANAFA